MAVNVYRDSTAVEEEYTRVADTLEFNQAILSSSEQGIVVINIHGKCVYINQAGADICDCTISQMMQFDYFKLETWKKTGLLDASRRVLETGIPEWVIFSASKMSVEKAWFCCRLSRFLSKGQTYLLILGDDITKNKKTEEALQESERRFQSLLESTKDVIYRLNLLSGHYEYISPSSEVLVGYTPEEIAAFDVQTDLTFVHPEDLEGLRAAFAGAAETGQGEAEYRQRTRDGGYRWLSNRMSIMYDADGRPIYRNGIIRDITRRKQAEERLRESEECFRAVQENALDCFAILKPLYSDQGEIVDFIYVYQNSRSAKRIGRSPEELAGCHVTDFYPTFAQSLFFRMNKQVVETGQPLEFEDQYKAAGSDVWFHSTVIPLPSGIAVTLQDITERKRTEEALRRALLREKVLSGVTSCLLQSEDPQAIMDDICRKAIEFVGCDVFINYVTENGCLRLNAYTGIPFEVAVKIERLEYGEAISGAVAQEVNCIVVPDVQNSLDPRAQLIKSIGIQAYVCFPLKSDANVIGTLSFGSKKHKTFTDEALQFMNNVSGHISIALNRLLISKSLRESEQRARVLISELEEADKNKNQFLSVLSHELRNPLAAITAGLSLMEISDDTKHTTNAKEIIHRQVKQLCKLVDDLLDLTRINQNKIQLKKEAVQLNEIILNIVDDMKLGFKEKGIHFWVRLQSQPVYVYADRVRITQCIGNILTNALKFTQKTGDVWLTLEKTKKDAVISVRDNGIGISPETMGQLFKPFMRADHSQEQQINNGLGLGLSIVKNLVEMHDGQVDAHSDGIGCGAAFTIRLPLTAVLPSEK